QLGNGIVISPNIPVSSPVPVAVIGMSSGTVAIAPGAAHTCAVTSAGGVKCWGQDAFGALGQGTMNKDSSVPLDVGGVSSAVAVGSGLWFSCVATAAGKAKCWGHNEHGQLGNNTTVSSSVPVDVVGL